MRLANWYSLLVRKLFLIEVFILSPFCIHQYNKWVNIAIATQWNEFHSIYLLFTNFNISANSYFAHHSGPHSISNLMYVRGHSHSLSLSLFYYYLSLFLSFFCSNGIFSSKKILVGIVNIEIRGEKSLRWVSINQELLNFSTFSPLLFPNTSEIPGQNPSLARTK